MAIQHSNKSQDDCMSEGQKARMKRQLHKLEPLLELEGEFTYWDIAEKLDCKPGFISTLKREGLIKQVDRGIIRKGYRPVGVYKWRKRSKQRVQEWVAQKKTIPCPQEHRAHIYNDPETPEDTLGCKYCAEQGNHPVLAKDTVRDCL